MVLMSLVKSPIARLLLRNTAARPVPWPARRCVRLLMAALTSSSRGCSCRRRKRREREHWNIAADGTAGTNANTRISCARTYVRRVTAAAVEGRSRRCQGLHSETFLPYGSSHMGDWPAACHQSLRNGFQLGRPYREDECTDY